MFTIVICCCFVAMLISACASYTTKKKSKYPGNMVAKQKSLMSSKTPIRIEQEESLQKTKEPQQRLVSPKLDFKNVKEAISYCCKTRMLSMRMASLYGVQVLKDYPVEKRKIVKKRLDDAMMMTNSIYDSLLSYAPVTNQPELETKVKSSHVYWLQLEKALSKEPTKDDFLIVLEMSDKLLVRNETMTKLLEAQSPDSQSKFINIAGRQSLYAMKLARDYLAASMDIDKEHRMGSMLETVNVFDSAMLALESAPRNTLEIGGVIKSITKMEWKKVYDTVNKCLEGNGKKFNVFVMINFCETLLDKTDRLTKMYTEVG